MKRLVISSLLLFFLSGCYQASLSPAMNIAGPAAGAAHGRLASSAISTGFSYGIKHKTGKFPIEHVIKREKDKVVNKVALLGNEAKKSSEVIKKKIIKSSENILQKKDEIKSKDSNQLRQLKWVLKVKKITSITQEEVFAANKPRYSYWSKQK